jgi:hypothetical protein
MDVLYGSDPMLDRYQVIKNSCYDVSNMKVLSDVGCVRVNWHGARNNIPHSTSFTLVQ